VSVSVSVFVRVRVCVCVCVCVLVCFCELFACVFVGVLVLCGRHALCFGGPLWFGLSLRVFV
jgi:hypothetical protein